MVINFKDDSDISNKVFNILSQRHTDVYDLSFRFGKVGIAYFLFNFSKLHNSEKYYALGFEIIENLYSELNSNEVETLSIPSIGWLFSYLTEIDAIDFDSDRLLRDMDLYLLNKLEKENNIDLGLDWILGIGGYFLSRYKTSSSLSLKREISFGITLILDEIYSTLNEDYSLKTSIANATKNLPIEKNLYPLLRLFFFIKEISIEMKTYNFITKKIKFQINSMIKELLSLITMERIERDAELIKSFFLLLFITNNIVGRNENSIFQQTLAYLKGNKININCINHIHALLNRREHDRDNLKSRKELKQLLVSNSEKEINNIIAQQSIAGIPNLGLMNGITGLYINSLEASGKKMFLNYEKPIVLIY